MAASVRFAEIALPLPVDQVFSYSIPDNLLDAAMPGHRVSVAFTNRRMTGVITALSDTSPVKRHRPLLDVLDRDPVMDATLLELTRWIGRYYLCPWGEAIKAALPAGLLSESEQIVSRDGPVSPRVHGPAAAHRPPGRPNCSPSSPNRAPSPCPASGAGPASGSPSRSCEASRQRAWCRFRSAIPAVRPSGTRPGSKLIPSKEEAAKIVSRLLPRAARQAGCINFWRGTTAG